MPVHPSVHPSVFLFIWLLWYVADNFSNVSSCLIAVVVLLVAGFTLELIFVMSSMLLLYCFSCFQNFLYATSYFCVLIVGIFSFLKKKVKSLVICHQRNLSTFDYWVFSSTEIQQELLNNYLFVCSFHLFFLLHILKFLCFLAKLLFSLFWLHLSLLLAV